MLALRCAALRILATIGSRCAVRDLAERTLLRIHVGIFFIHFVAAEADGVAPAAIKALQFPRIDLQIVRLEMVVLADQRALLTRWILLALAGRR